ncbi:hypothetical protein T492DRAFT_843547 [Pavlovales sp. CCMP2436]|nr:hypothetical protein T492DRAFT_843547 [Pavlovales sp. CCMP2436]
MGSIDLREKAISLANEAVTADNAGQYELALTKYVAAIETFTIAVKYERAQSVQDTIRAKCLEYMERAEYLKKQVRGETGAPKALRAGGGKSLDEDDADDGGGGLVGSGSRQSEADHRNPSLAAR